MKRRILILTVAAITAMTMVTSGVFAAEGIAAPPAGENAAVQSDEDAEMMTAQTGGTDGSSAVQEDNTGADPGTVDPEPEPQPEPEPEPEPEPVKSGWVTNDDGKTYYYQDGVPVKGVKKIKGKQYLFSSSGVLVVKGKNKKFTYKKKTYYSLGKGVLFTGVKKIGKKLYLFNKKNGALVVKKKGVIFKYGGSSYYSLGKGVLGTGWQAVKVKKKLNGYYFYPKTGKMAKNTTIGHLRIPKNGKLHEAYALGIQTLNKKGWNLRAAYTFSYKLKYYDRWYRTSSSEKYSLRGFKENHGNCYVMAATFYIMAKLLGYNIHQVYGKVGLPHSWTEIKEKGGKVYVYDPNFRNETGRNGWRIWYGKKGTWRYHKKGQLNKFVD